MAWLCLGRLAAAEAEDIATGRLVPVMICRADAAQTYAVYVPSSYDPTRKWPILCCFDPGARGVIPVERFQAAAEKYGYIVAGSNTSRNGPIAGNLRAMDALLRDTSTQWRLDAKRVYAAGFSGGARMACEMGLLGLAKGVVACSGGFPQNETPKKVPFPFFGTAGTEDFNYHELRQIDRDLDQRRTPHRVMIFPGGHEWLPAALAAEAIEWLEIQAMRAGTRPKDETLIQRSFQARLAAAESLPLAEAWAEFKALSENFAGLLDISAVESRVKKLARSQEVHQWIQQDRSLEERRLEMNEKLLALAEDNELDRLRATVANWQKHADAAQDSPDRRLMRRVLQGAAITAGENARALLAQDEYRQAITWLQLAIALRPERAQAWYDLARAEAMAGNKREALAALRQAHGAGFKDSVRVEQEAAFKSLRKNAAFLELLETMKK